MIEANILHSRGKDMVCLVEYAKQQYRGKKVIVYKHGFCGNKITPHRMIVNLSHQLIEDGYTIVRFDCVGSGDSEGGPQYMTIPGHLQDYKRVLHWVTDTLKPEKLMLLGYSMGGIETSLCCREVPIDGILFWSPCSNSCQCFRHLIGDSLFEQGRAGKDVDFGGDRVGKEFFIDLDKDELDPLKAIKGFDKPVYFIHGSGDTDVPAENSERYLANLPHAVRHLIQGAGHGYDRVEWQEELLAYSKEYIELIMHQA